MPMTRFPRLLHNLMQLVCTLLTLLVDGWRYFLLCLRPSPALAAENLFLRKQLALYQEHHLTPRRATNAIRITLVWLSRCFDWRQALVVVQPETLVRWHRQVFLVFWRGHRVLDVRQFLPNCERLSAAWPVTTRRGRGAHRQ
jgi:hypothetical protein